MSTRDATPTDSSKENEPDTVQNGTPAQKKSGRLTLQQHKLQKEEDNNNNHTPKNRFLRFVRRGSSVVRPTIASTAAEGRGQSNWTRLRILTGVVHGFTALSDDIKTFGPEKRHSELNWGEVLSSTSDYDINKHWWIIMPSNVFKKVWELFVIILLLYVAVVVPIRVCFDMETSPEYEQFDLFVDVCFILDVFIQCVSAYVDKYDNKVKVGQMAILRNYARGWMFIDVIASVPVYQIVDGLGGADSQINRLGRLARLPRLFRLAKLLRLLKLLRMFKFGRYMNIWESQMTLSPSTARLVKVSFGVTMVTHMIACLWYLCSWAGEDHVDPNSWVRRHGIADESIATKYITSLYWAFSTLTTLGYGDISAFTNVERVFSIICMVLGVTWYAFIISTISSIINAFDKRSALKRRKLASVSEFIKATKLPKDLRIRVRDYFSHLYSSPDIHPNLDAAVLVEEMSTSLRVEVVLYMHRRIIPLIPFFKHKSPQFVAGAVTLLMPIKAGIGEYIMQEGTHADDVFFLTHGRAVASCNGRKYRAIVEGSYFGEIGCILTETRKTSARAVTKCDLFALSKRNLVYLMTEFPEVGDHIRNIAAIRFKHLCEFEPSLKQLFPGEIAHLFDHETGGEEEEELYINSITSNDNQNRDERSDVFLPGEVSPDLESRESTSNDAVGDEEDRTKVSTRTIDLETGEEVGINGSPSLEDQLRVKSTDFSEYRPNEPRARAQSTMNLDSPTSYIQTDVHRLSAYGSSGTSTARRASVLTHKSHGSVVSQERLLLRFKMMESKLAKLKSDNKVFQTQMLQMMGELLKKSSAVSETTPNVTHHNNNGLGENETNNL